jgi:hypothetical protein
MARSSHLNRRQALSSEECYAQMWRSQTMAKKTRSPLPLRMSRKVDGMGGSPTSCSCTIGAS